MRRLVVCADGTWNSADREEKRTNVSHLHGAVRPRARDGTEQRVFYDEGVGAKGGMIDVLTGGAFGTGLSDNILDGYRYLVGEYEPGDELYFIGFSRGAYTVRSLAGLVRNCGIVKREHAGRAKEAFKLYRDRGDDTHPNSVRARDFRKEYSHEARIRFLGVWDTVGALGVPTRGPLGKLSRRRHGFHDVRLSSWVENAAQALAIDERRKPYAPSVWEVRASEVGKDGQRVEQRWFPGVHSNVGGGYPDRVLSNLALCWIADRARAAGLDVDETCGTVPEGHHGGRLYDSMALFFKPFGAQVRAIGVERRDPETDERLETFEVVDASATRRRGDATLSPPYDPPNWSDFWERAVHG